ncbi:MAG TPA: sensor histidine kinase KdpD [bacterium]|nr:sensor histidine kinase KdpD [bacterium]
MMEANRPDPDALLKAIQTEEQLSRRGKLKIFFGMCAGVGKTYAMLEAAQRKKKEGVDVVIGYVEPHKRQETEVLTEGIERIPTKPLAYHHVTLQEFDIDAALARKPSLILVDELAHTNAPGSRNVKRWQDVEELLQAGIDVYSTLNTQHLESLNNSVAQITGIVVRETIPDEIFDRSDEVELVDLPVPELLQRLKEGKVYMTEQAGRAAENFFQEGKLMALREIALRKTAQRVDFQMTQYRTLHAVKGVWQAGERLLVCVGPGPFSTRLIRRTKQMANELKAPWMAVYVETPQKPMGEEKREAIENQIRFAQSLGAETAVLQGLKPGEEILKFAHEKNVTKIVVGKSRRPRWKDFLFGSLVDELVRGSGDIDVYSISGEKGEQSPKWKTDVFRSPWTQYSAPLLVIVAWTGIAKWLLPHVEIVNVSMIYLLMNVMIAVRYGQGPSLAAAFLSVACFDFFFVPPYFTFSVSDARYWVTFLVVLSVTLLTSRLTFQLRRSAEAASARERYTSNLYALSREMLKSRTTREISAAVAQHLAQVAHGDAIILLGSEPELMFLEATSNPNWHFDETDRAVAHWASKNAKSAGKGTQTLPMAKAIFFPLIGSRGVIGVAGIRPSEDTAFLESAGQHFVESVIGQGALAIERAMLAEEARSAEVEAEREGLMSALLSSVSHDLRTPLTSIAGAAGTLLDQDQKLSPEDRRRLLESIEDESARLNRLVENILQITKIESGNVALRKEKHSLEEIIGSALNRLDASLRGRKIATDIPEDLPLVPMDGLLMEQVMVNLLENAGRYTPAGSPIDIRAWRNGKYVQVEVADRGPGVSASDRTRVFEKFYRSGKKDVWGSGLGLAICQGILKVHQGEIGVKERDGGGSVFYFSLPLDTATSDSESRAAGSGMENGEKSA